MNTKTTVVKAALLLLVTVAATAYAVHGIAHTGLSPEQLHSLELHYGTTTAAEQAIVAQHHGHRP